MKKLHPFSIKVVLSCLLLIPVLQLTLGADESPIYYKYFWYFIIGIIFISILVSLWLRKRERTKDLTRFYLISNTFLRYYLAFFIGMYAISKMAGVQFQIYEHVRDIPIGKLSGFNLTWYYYGYSLGLTIIVGLIQYTSAIFLVFRRTQLAGALLLLPVIVNIVFTNIFYEIGYGPGLNSIHFTLICFYIIWLNSDWIVEALQKYYHILPGAFTSKKSKIVRIVARVLVLGLPLVLIAIVPKILAEPDSPLDGVWRIKKQLVNGEEVNMIPDTVTIKNLYINNKNSAVLNLGDRFFGGAISINEGQQKVKIRWGLKQDSLVGKYTVRDSILVIDGKRADDSVVYQFEWVRETKYGK